jgi:hypothetical protein
MENKNIGNTHLQNDYNSKNQPHCVPYISFDRGYVVSNGIDYVEVENVIIAPQENPPL